MEYNRWLFWILEQQLDKNIKDNGEYNEGYERRADDNASRSIGELV